MAKTIPDIIDHLIGIVPGSKLDAIRLRRPATKDNADKSYRALFEPETVEDASLAERFATAAFIAELHGDTAFAGFYGQQLAALPGGVALLKAVKAAAVEGAGKGPYGHYPAGPLTAEDQDGPSYDVSDDLKAVLGTRLSAAIEHTHLLVFHLRDAEPAALSRLIAAGWTTTGIVTLSQLIAFLAFQIRVVAGLRVLAAA